MRVTIDVLYGLKIAFSSVYLDRIQGRISHRSILKILLKKGKKKKEIVANIFHM